MTPYFILSWPTDDADANMTARRIRSAVVRTKPRWQLLIDEPGALIALGSNARVIETQIEGCPAFLIGDVFPKAREGRSAQALLSDTRSFPDLCTRLAEAYWGAYIAIHIRHRGDIAIFRDPVGMRDGLHWTHSGVCIFASEAMPWLAASPPSRLSIDWWRVAALLLDSATVAEEPPLSEVRTLTPGSLVDIRLGRTTTRRLWAPGRFYEQGRSDHLDATALRDVVLRCVEAWTTTYPDNIIEVSGGLDSATVAAAGSATTPGLQHAINFFTDHLSGDERGYARDVCARCSIPLDEVFMPVGRLGARDIRDIPVDARPGLSSVTLFHDTLLARIAVEHGATALFTGHGGDSVFYQHPTAMIAADPSFPRRSLHAYAALAKWSKESIWTVGAYAFRLPVRPAKRTENEAVVGLPLCRAQRARSAWEGDLEGFPPAKRNQIAAIATDRSVIAPSCRSQALTVVHPLLSQPLVELAIATDIFLLTEGRRDRALARKAFAQMLPTSVIERSGKGALAQFFGRCLCASIPFLRDFLLNGLLVGNGVIDRARLETMLDRDFLMRFDCYAKLRSAIIMEHWARVWQERIERMRANHKGARAAA